MKKLLRTLFLTLFAISLIACAKEPAVESITAPDLAALIATGDAPLILDVRTPKEFSAGHIPGAVNIPHTELEDRIAELSGSKNNTIVVHCRSGGRATTADEILQRLGFSHVIELEGHMLGWEKGDYPVERPTRDAG